MSLQRILQVLRKEARIEAGHHSRPTIDGPRHKDVQARGSSVAAKFTPKSSLRNKTKPTSENTSVLAPRDGRSAPHDVDEASVPIILSDSSASLLIGQTPQSTIKVSSWNGSKAVVKRCRSPNIPRAADNWRHEVNMLKLVGIHVSRFASPTFCDRSSLIHFRIISHEYWIMMLIASLLH